MDQEYNKQTGKISLEMRENSPYYLKRTTQILIKVSALPYQSLTDPRCQKKKEFQDKYPTKKRKTSKCISPTHVIGK